MELNFTDISVLGFCMLPREVETIAQLLTGSRGDKEAVLRRLLESRLLVPFTQDRELYITSGPQPFWRSVGPGEDLERSAVYLRYDTGVIKVLNSRAA